MKCPCCNNILKISKSTPMILNGVFFIYCKKCMSIIPEYKLTEEFIQKLYWSDNNEENMF